MRVLQLGLGAARREAVPERVLPGFLRRSVRLWIDKVSSAEEQAWRVRKRCFFLVCLSALASAPVRALGLSCIHIAHLAS